jgi:hypothetical protein
MSVTISAALKAHLAQPYHTLATCWKITRKDATVIGLTDHDLPIGPISGVTYQPLTGYTRSDVEGNTDFTASNMETTGILSSPSITESSLRAGLWDNADVEMFYVNWADLTMGILAMPSGKLGDVSIDKNFEFKATLLGLMESYSRIIGELTSPSCRAKLYDARCKVNPAGFTFTGSITGIHSSLMTYYDTARTEPGPTGGLAINSVTIANPGLVSCAPGGTSLFNGLAVTIYGQVGMPQVNTTVLIRNLSQGGAFDQFNLPFSTVGFPFSTATGFVVPLGSNTGYFDFGVLTFTSGLNAGLSYEIRTYSPGQFDFFLQPSYIVAIGDTYSIKAGCDLAFGTCKVKFNNVVNFRGEPYLPGLDKMVQTGKQP